MLIVYIALGILSGLLAATIALLSGAGILLSLIAYLVAGTVGIFVCVMWMIVKQIYCDKSSIETKKLNDGASVFLQ